MVYEQTITLRDGRACRLRNGTEADGQTLLDVFNLTHEQTDFLLSYPEEHTMTVQDESKYLREKAHSKREIEILAEVGGAVVGTAGIEAVGNKYKTRHRCDFGISVDRAYWGLGIGRALLQACITCARTAGFEQMELQVVSGNERAIALYRKAGFVEYGRNPRGFRSRLSGYQELVSMRLELTPRPTEAEA
ncbi:MAG: GNAT family N-acetyltransferase [Oscillospiraceae bacterium]|nr:GNAT family N-acetyltransferase [Oscillospiraceae bacterium]